MDDPKIDKFVKDRLNTWARRFELHDWRIRWYTVSMKSLGRVNVLPEYSRVEVDLDIQRHKDRDQLDDTIRHEMLHVLHAPFQEHLQLVSSVVDKKTFKVLQAAHLHSCERFVKHMEDILEDFDWND